MPAKFSNQQSLPYYTVACLLVNWAGAGTAGILDGSSARKQDRSEHTLPDAACPPLVTCPQAWQQQLQMQEEHTASQEAAARAPLLRSQSAPMPFHRQQHPHHHTHQQRAPLLVWQGVPHTGEVKAIPHVVIESESSGGRSVTHQTPPSQAACPHHHSLLSHTTTASAAVAAAPAAPSAAQPLQPGPHLQRAPPNSRLGHPKGAAAAAAETASTAAAGAPAAAAAAAQMQQEIAPQQTLGQPTSLGGKAVLGPGIVHVCVANNTAREAGAVSAGLVFHSPFAPAAYMDPPPSASGTSPPVSSQAMNLPPQQPLQPPLQEHGAHAQAPQAADLAHQASPFAGA